jgi:uncharacterized membrane protein
MIKVQDSIIISKPVEQVFAFAANYENDPQWRAEVSQLRYSSGGAVKVGSQAVEVSQVVGQRLETTTEVTQYEPNRKVVSKSISGPVPIVTYREFEMVPNGTRFTYVLEGDESGVLLFRLLRPILARWYQGQIGAYLRKLKQILEAKISNGES